MKLFLVLLALGEVGGVWGPVPYEAAECRRRAVEIIAAVHRGYDREGIGPELERFPGTKARRNDWRAHCVYAAQAPELGVKFNPEWRIVH